MVTSIADTVGVSESLKLNVKDDAVTLFPFNPNTMLSEDVGDTYQRNKTFSKISFLESHRKLLLEIMKIGFHPLEHY